MKNIQRLLPLIATVALFGCTTTPPSRFYVLTPQASAVEASRTADLVVGVGPVRLVDYLERPQIVARDGANLLRVEEFDRWGGTLETNVAWVMAENLSRVLGTDAVVTFPWERAVVPRFQVAIDIRQFDPASDNQVRLIAQWRILGDDDRALYAIEKSELTEVMGGTGFAAQVAAQSRLLARLSEAIAARIKQLGSSK